MRWFAIAALLGSSAAAAQEPEVSRVVLHPLGTPRGVAGADDIDAVLTLEAARQPIELVGSAEATEALGGKPCAHAELACLSALARATQARFALRVELVPASGAWELKAVVVRDDGALVREVESLRESWVADKPLKGARVVLKRLLDSLALGTLRSARPLVKAAPAVSEKVVEKAPPPVVEKSPELAPEVADAPEPEPRGGGVRMAGIGIGLAGLAAIGVGGALGGAAAAEAERLHVDDLGIIPESELPLRRSADATANAGLAMAIGGGLAAVTGLIMILVGGPAEPAADVAVTIVPGGAVVGFGMVLP